MADQSKQAEQGKQLTVRNAPGPPLAEIAWKGYDAAVRVATDSISQLSTVPIVGELAMRAFEVSLRVTRFNNALAGAFFSALWPAVGLPTATEIRSLRRELAALREELRQTAPAAHTDRRAAHLAADADSHPATRAVARIRKLAAA